MDLVICHLMNTAVVVLVRAQGTAETGQRYQLTCTVTRNDGSVPVISWMNSGRLISSNMSGIFLGSLRTNGVMSSSELLFDPLILGHEGNYTCLAAFGATTFSYTYSVAVIASRFR